MASEHESNSYDDSDSIYCGSSLDGPCSLNEKQLSDISNSKSGSQPLLHQHHGNEHTSSQNLPSSSNQPLGTESSSFQDCQPQSIHQPQGISNTLESSNPQYHQTSENKLSKFQDMVITPSTEITPSVDDAYLQPNNQPETEFGRTQNILPLSEEQPSEPDDSHPLAIHVSHTLSSVNSATHQQFWMEQLRSQGSDAVLHPSDACSLIVKQAENAVYCDSLGNEFIYHPDAKGGYFEYCRGDSEIQGSIMQSLQQFESTENYLQSLLTQALQQPEFRTNYFQSLHTQGIQQSESDQNAMIPSSEIKSTMPGQYSIMRRYLKRSIVNKDAFSLSQQPGENRTREIPRFQQVPEKLKLNYPTERYSLRSPFSVTQKQFEKDSLEVQHAISRSIASRASNTLLDRFLEMCIANDQSRSLNQSFSRPNHYDLGMLQRPYANKSESMNILVCGDLIWTTRLIQTFSRQHSVKYKSPFNLVWKQTVTRCGIKAAVSVWQVGYLNNSVQFLKSSCMSSKTTIMYLFNLRKESLQPIIGFIRREVNPTVPVVFVGCIPLSISNQAILKLTKAGFLLKAKSDLKAFLVCYVNSVEEVDSVFFTAIDASLLHTI